MFLIHIYVLPTHIHMFIFECIHREREKRESARERERERERKREREREINKPENTLFLLFLLWKNVEAKLQSSDKS